MEIAGTHNTVYQIALVCHKEQSLGLFIQTACRINPYRIVQIVRYRGFFSLLLCTADNALRLVEQKQYPAFLLHCPYTIYIYFCTGTDPVPRLYRMSVYHNPACTDQPVCLPSGADARFAQILINSYVCQAFCLRMFIPFFLVHCSII